MSNKFIKTKPNSATVSKKKNKKAGIIIFSVIYILIFLIILIPNISNKGYTDKSVDAFVFDDFEVFSDSQESQINTNCKRVQQKYGVNVYISTCERKSYFSSSSGYYYNYDYSSNYYATQIGTDFIWQHNFNYSDNLVIIILNCQKFNESERYDYHFDVYTFGSAASAISDSEVDKIIWSSAGDDIISSNSEQATSGLISMTTDLGKAYAGILSYRWGIIILVTAIIGALIALGVTKGIKRSYSKKRDNESYSFSANTNLNLTVREDIFSHKNVTYVHIDRGSSSGGGGGHSSGGGGGGGHRGGR